MATLTLNGSTSGNVVVTVPAISGTGNTITIPATTGTLSVQPSALTTGSVLFANSSGQIAQNNSQFFWDNTNNYLGIGTSSPSTYGKFAVQTQSANTPTVAITSNSLSPQLNHYITDSTSVLRNLNQIGFVTGSSDISNYQGYMTFSTMGAAGGAISERMRIDASGNVGIGTTSPAQKLHVQGAGNTYIRIQDTQANGYNAATLYANDQRTFRVGTLGTVGGFTNGAFIVYDETAAAWRMVIDASGNLLVGTTSATSGEAKLILSTNSGTTNWRVGPWATVSTNFYVTSNSATTGVYLNGTSATTWSGLSDERFKENLLPITDAIDKINTLRTVTGNFIQDEAKTPHAFLIAQDILEVLPEAVDTANPDMYGLAYTETIPLAIAAIKELSAKLDAAEARIAALEGAN